ncbi:interferon lambda-1 [Thamnophis elegans]|uniref:interferon lambda-1 n=1 Tax=Thamnophis elegans TaxID=35005 RepID=UPI001377C4F2|nr:interferon lambda-1 [Thamnophis elegans]
MGPRNWLLGPLALLILLEATWVQSLPLRSCRFPQIPEHLNSFRELRNQYEDEMFKGGEPWKNCTSPHLRFPQVKMDRLRNKWEMMEAVEVKLALMVPVLQNVSEAAFSKHASKVLEFLHPLQEVLATCIRDKAPHGQKSSPLQHFQEEIQKFNARSTQQSHKCLEAAVGLHIVRLLEKDIHQLRHHFHHRHRHHLRATTRLG